MAGGYPGYYNSYSPTAYPATYPTAYPTPAQQYPAATPYPVPTPAQQSPSPPTQAPAPGAVTWCTEQQAIDFVPPSGPAVALWLQDKPTIYLKSLDSMGKPMTVILDYQERAQAAPVAPGKNVAYATKDDLEALREEFAPVLALIQQTRKKEDNDNGKSVV